MIEILIAEQAAAEEMERARRFALAWQTYRGDTPRPLVVRPGEPDDNVRVNLAGVIVDAGVDFLFGEDLVFELAGEGAEGTDSPAEEWLGQVWEANRRMTTLQKLGTNGAVCGHAFIKLQTQELAEAPPRLIVLDPACVRVVWDQEDIEQVLAYVITWTVLGGARAAVRRQRIERAELGWQIVDEISRASGRWDLIASTPWPHDWPPVVDCQSLPVPNEFWGRSDLSEDIIEAVRGLNAVLSDVRRSVRIHAHPKVWAKGISDEARLDVAPDQAIVLPDPESELGTIEARSDPLAIELYRRLKEVFHESARVPEIASGRLDDVGNLSGLALQILYGPLVRKTRTKRRLYGDLIREVNRRLIELRFGPQEPQTTIIHWPELLPSDPREAAEVALLDRELGASRDTLLAGRGYDPEAEAAKREDEASAQAEAQIRAFDRGAGA